VPRRQRLDAELVRRRLVPSRTEAAHAVEAGRVLVNGAVADKPSRQVHAGDAVRLTGPGPRFVSRGGEKLAAALDTFAIDVAGLRVLDAGASTGGFTDCLLQRGVAAVVALDVGHGQLHPKIRNDSRVTVFERVHIRDADVAMIGGLTDMVVADLSFISLTRVLPALVAVCVPRGSMVLLVKPQFEAGRAEVARGRGVVTDPDIHERVCRDIDAALVAAGCAVRGWTTSPITGTDGNREFLVFATTPSGESPVEPPVTVAS
jgi:23S rRNA (cytidine1920-2'-O)/16S rRNA (cytidine1409-2'-O)-methyltransferase